MRWRSDVTGALSLHNYCGSAMSSRALEATNRHGRVRPLRDPARASTWASLLLGSLMFVPVLLPRQSLAQSQEVPSESGVSQSNQMDAPARPVQTLEAPQPKPPIGALNMGYLYIASEEAPGTWQYHLHGFFVIPQINVNHWLSFIGDFTSSYNTSAGAHQNVQARLGGVVFTAKSSKKISPF